MGLRHHQLGWSDRQVLHVISMKGRWMGLLLHSLSYRDTRIHIYVRRGVANNFSYMVSCNRKKLIMYHVNEKNCWMIQA